MRDRQVIAAVVLAAGASTRLGKPKQLVVLGGETLLERAVRTALKVGCQPIIVVLGANAAAIRRGCELEGVIVLENAAWEEGMASSIRVAINAVGEADGVVLMTCDQPSITADHLHKLMASGQVTASAYAGRHGVPAYFPAASFPALLQLAGDTGARELLRNALAVQLADGDLDVDTERELLLARQMFG